MVWIFFLIRYGCVSFENELYVELNDNITGTARSSFIFRIILRKFRLFSTFSQNYTKNERWPGRSGYIIIQFNVKLIFERYTTIPDQKKNPDQKILFFHGEIQFSKCGIWTEFRPIRQVVILFREGLQVHHGTGHTTINQCF